MCIRMASDLSKLSSTHCPPSDKMVELDVFEVIDSVEVSLTASSLLVEGNLVECYEYLTLKMHHGLHLPTRGSAERISQQLICE